MKKSILYETLRISKQNVENHPYHGRKYHYSYIISKNTILGWSTNKNFSLPKHFGYDSRIDNNTAFMHSEIAAWYKTKGLLQGRKFQLINIRINKSGELRISRPCVCCHTILNKLGCNKFYYSSNIGFLVC